MNARSKVRQTEKNFSATSMAPKFFQARSETKNQVQGLFPPEHTTSIADASAAAAEKKK